MRNLLAGLLVALAAVTGLVALLAAGADINVFTAHDVAAVVARTLPTSDPADAYGRKLTDRQRAGLRRALPSGKVRAALRQVTTDGGRVNVARLTAQVTKELDRAGRHNVATRVAAAADPTVDVSHALDAVTDAVHRFLVATVRWAGLATGLLVLLAFVVARNRMATFTGVGWVALAVDLVAAPLLVWALPAAGQAIVGAVFGPAAGAAAHVAYAAHRPGYLAVVGGVAAAAAACLATARLLPAPARRPHPRAATGIPDPWHVDR